jgi:hypothetical protein
MVFSGPLRREIFIPAAAFSARDRSNSDPAKALIRLRVSLSIPFF